MCNECSDADLRAILGGTLPAAEEALLHRHLEVCEECSSALEHMAGGSAWCEEAAALLVRDEFDDVHLQEEPWSEIDFTVEHLEPTDQASDLGRLGGYDVQEIVGRGGMGVVLKAYDRELKRCVAIKVLAPHLAQSSLAKRRFTREAQAAAAVVHPNVLAIHQVQPTGRLPFLVMPFVAGESLAHRIKRQGSLDLKEVLRIGVQAAAGLAAAHEQGLVHRDVKPANILLERGVERAVLTDFGLARAADDLALTRNGVIAGTPQYMSPEQARGEALDARSDLFSLGCVLYEMATGVSPFLADSTFATLRRLVDEEPVSIAARNPELPTWFVAIVNKLMEKEPSRRFSSALEVSELLERCLAHLQQPAHVPLPVAVPSLKTAIARRRGRKWVLLGALVLVLGLGGGIAFIACAQEPSKISGEWASDEWGEVTLKETAPGEYKGTYTNALPVMSDVVAKRTKEHEGTIEVVWNRIERRYNGTWHEGENRFGTLSVRVVGDEIRGAWTTSRESAINPGTPALADLIWAKRLVATVEVPPSGKLTVPRDGTLQFGPVIERTVNDISVGKDSFLNLERGELLTPPENVRDLEEMQAWAKANNADVAGCGDAGGSGLRIFDGLAGSPIGWDATPSEVASAIRNTEDSLEHLRATNPGLQGPSEMGFVNMWFSKVASPNGDTFFIKTRGGRIGLLQLLGYKPTIVVRAKYPGASPEVISETVAKPIEAAVGGVENMLHMSSESAVDGTMELTAIFEPGTDVESARRLVERRVATVETKLPEAVLRLGVYTTNGPPNVKNMPGVSIRYKLLQTERGDRQQTKRQRFVPVEGIANDTSWSVFEPPSFFSKTDWAVMASMTVGGEARIQLPGDEEPRCVIRLVKGDDESVVIEVRDLPKPSAMEVSIARGQSAKVTINGEGYSIAYNSVQVSANDPDTSPFAHIVVRRMQPPQPGRNRKGRNGPNVNNLQTVDADGPNAYRAYLWGAGRIALVGCCENPSHDHSWWNPIGDPLQIGDPLGARPYDQLGATVTPDAASVSREFVVQLSSLPPDADAKWDIPAALGIAGGGAPMHGGESQSNLRALAARVPASARTIDIRFGIAIHAWDTIAEHVASGIPSVTSATNAAHGSCVFAPSRTIGDKFVQLVSHNVVDRAVRLVIVDREGKVIPAESTSIGGAGDVLQLEATFDAVALSDARRIKFQSRPYQWFEFKDVHVYPNSNEDNRESSSLGVHQSLSTASEATDSTGSRDNLRDIAQAMLGYAALHKHLPPASIIGPDGKTPHSWRVALLPFLDQQELHDRYRFDEPWDSLNNTGVLKEMPSVYRHPGDDRDGTNSSYFALTGPGIVSRSAASEDTENASGRASDAILVVEAKRDIPWTKPEDIGFEPNESLPEFGGFSPDGWNAAFADGAVRFITKSVNETELKAMITNKHDGNSQKH